MDFKDIKQIVELMKRADLTEFEIKDNDLKLRISRQQGELKHSHAAPFAVPPQVSYHPKELGTKAESSEPAVKISAEEAGIHLIKSPMVGTFYSASSPDGEPFVSVKSVVKKDTVVCIIEAMKVMNEIQSEIAGTITEVLLENGDPVEYGQPLFKVKLSS